MMEIREQAQPLEWAGLWVGGTHLVAASMDFMHDGQVCARTWDGRGSCIVLGMDGIAYLYTAYVYYSLYKLPLTWVDRVT